MKSPSQRRAAFAALLLAPTLAACGFNAQTDQVYQPSTGVNDRDGSVDVLNALIVSGTDGSGTFAATLVNNDQDQSDELTGVTGEGVTASMEPVAVSAAGVVNLAESGDVSILGDAVKAGGWVSLTLTFANGDTSSVRVPVVTDTGDYTEVPLPKRTKPADEATDGATDGATEEPSDEPTAEATE